MQNYIGTIIFKGEQLNIFPKVFKADEDDTDTEDLRVDDLINNLVIWLGYCDRLNFLFVTMRENFPALKTYWSFLSPYMSIMFKRR